MPTFFSTALAILVALSVCACKSSGNRAGGGPQPDDSTLSGTTPGGETLNEGEDTPPTAPKAITGLSSRSRYRAIKVNWKKEDGLKYVVVRTTDENLKLKDGTEYQPGLIEGGTVIANTSDDSAYATELTPDTQYLLRIFAYDPKEKGLLYSPGKTIAELAGPYERNVLSSENVRFVSRQGKFLFVLEDQYLNIFEVLNVGSTVLRSRILAPNNPVDFRVRPGVTPYRDIVQLRDNYLFILDEPQLKIYNLSDPMSPQLISATSLTIGGTACRTVSMSLKDNLLAIPCGYYRHYYELDSSGSETRSLIPSPVKGFLLVDITNRAAPQILSETSSYIFGSEGNVINFSGAVSMFQSHILRNNILVVGSSGSYNLFDISNPRVPRFHSRLDGSTWGNSSAIQGNYMYTGDSLYTYDISDPRDPELLDRTSGGAFAKIATGSLLWNAYAIPTYFIDRTLSYTCFDIKTDPSRPTPLHELTGNLMEADMDQMYLGNSSGLKLVVGGLCHDFI